MNRESLTLAAVIAAVGFTIGTLSGLVVGRMFSPTTQSVSTAEKKLASCQSTIRELERMIETSTASARESYESVTELQDRIFELERLRGIDRATISELRDIRAKQDHAIRKLTAELEHEKNPLGI